MKDIFNRVARRVFTPEHLRNQIWKTGKRERFAYTPNPTDRRNYKILEYDFKTRVHSHVGGYWLIDESESQDITEKKVSNVVSLLNKNDELIDISQLTNYRVLFQVVDDKYHTKIALKHYDGKNIWDNALFVIRKGILHDEYSERR